MSYIDNNDFDCDAGLMSDFQRLPCNCQSSGRVKSCSRSHDYQRARARRRREREDRPDWDIMLSAGLRPRDGREGSLAPEEEERE